MSDMLTPLVRQWMQKIRRSEKSALRMRHDNRVKMVRQFYSEKSGFMWEAEFRKEHLGGMIPPEVTVTVNKAWEFVSIYGPYLFWQYPGVRIETVPGIMPPAELFGDPQSPEVQQIMQGMQAEESSRQAQQDMRNRMMKQFLEYSQREQPGQASLEIELFSTDALLSGCGVMAAQELKFPGSDRRLAMMKQYPSSDLFVDPDCQRVDWSDAQWIALKHTEPTWQVEKKFRLGSGSLKQFAMSESYESQAVNQSSAARSRRDNRDTFDQVTWYEVWSRSGVGSRMNYLDDGSGGNHAIHEDLHNAFEDTVGDFAYLCIIDGAPFPLNCPDSRLKGTSRYEAATDEEVAAMFAWRAADYGPEFPIYKDKRWPVERLYFYHEEKNPYPVPPLSPAIGELMAINILTSLMLTNAKENGKQIIAVAGAYLSKVEEKLRTGANPVVLELDEASQTKSINEVIQFLNRPDGNKDPYALIQQLEHRFEQRTGLVDFLYGTQQTQDRTAATTKAKQEHASVRPEKMAKDVARVVTGIFDAIKFFATWNIRGDDVRELLGPHGAHFWDALIVQQDPEVVVREMTCTVEASDMRRPSTERMLSNARDYAQSIMPVLQTYAQQTGDSEPLNGYFRAINAGIEDDVMPTLKPWQPPPPTPEQQQMQQQQMQMEQAKLQAELQSKQVEGQNKGIEGQNKQIDGQVKQLDAQGKQIDLQAKQVDLAIKQQDMQSGGADAAHLAEIQRSSEKHQQTLEQEQDEHDQKMLHDSLEFIQDLSQTVQINSAKQEGP